ncbi:Rv3654c family TadE-like protein [Gordonia sp. (in: high G+C Gram-positive bacteria)]|uniref:Rv3654c family TadE-like protein n=1 Tax=Gordonia sp. (in: high G+C Gram-positive bacteria) TaxID=84139 RepID=UPI0039E57908
MRRLLGEDDGSATPAGVAVVACLIALTLVLVHLGSAVLGRHRAAAAADLSALAAAAAVLAGEDGCATASRVVRAQGDPAMRLASCTVDGDFVDVRVEVPLNLGRFGVATARAEARAGPVES